METKLEDGKIIIKFFDGDKIGFHWGHLGEVIEAIKIYIKDHEEEYGLKVVKNERTNK